MEKEDKKCRAYQAHSTTGLWSRHRGTNTEEENTMRNEIKEGFRDPKAGQCRPVKWLGTITIKKRAWIIMEKRKHVMGVGCEVLDKY